MLGQCMERQANPPVVLERLSQEYLDECCEEAFNAAHSEYTRIFGRLCYFNRKDYSL